MEKYTIICDPSERPDDTRSIMENDRFRKVIKEVRLWSFLKNLTTIVHQKCESTTNDEEDEMVFELDSAESRQKRKNVLEQLLKNNVRLDIEQFKKMHSNNEQIIQISRNKRKLTQTVKHLKQLTTGYNFRNIRKMVGYQKVRRSPFIKHDSYKDSQKYDSSISNLNSTTTDESSSCSNSAGGMWYFSGNNRYRNSSSSSNNSDVDVEELKVGNDDIQIKNRKRKLNLNASNSNRALQSTQNPQSFISVPKKRMDLKDPDLYIPKQMIHNICIYHQNMVRQHPKKERTLAEQYRRNRNTEACRFSRRAKKLEELVIETQYYEKAQKNEEIMRESLKAILYIKKLLEVTKNQSNLRTE